MTEVFALEFASLVRRAVPRWELQAPAHQPDQYVSLEQLARCEAFMRGLAATREIG